MSDRTIKQSGYAGSSARVGLDNPTSVRPILAQTMRRSVPTLPWVLRSGVEVSVNGFVRESDLRRESSQRQAVQ